MKLCEKCGQELPENALTCPTCGEAKETAVPPAPAKPNALGLIIRFKKWIAVGVAAVLVAVLLLCTLTGGAPAGVLYMKDGEVFFTNGGDGWQVTDEFMGSASAKEQEKAAAYVDRCTFLADNGNLFYCDSLRDDGVLACRPCDDPDGEVIEITKDVDSFTASINGDQVIYVTGEKGLYYHNLEEKQKIASHVGKNRYWASAEADRVVFADDLTLYYWELGEDKIKIAEEVSSHWINQAFDTVYYVADDAFYKQEIGGDKEKLMDEPVNIRLKIYEDDRFHFTVGEDDDKVLYYYDGSEITKLGAYTSERSTDAADVPVFVYANEDGMYVVAEGTVTPVTCNEPSRLGLTSDGETLYYLDNKLDNKADLFRVSISGGVPDAPEKLDSDVWRLLMQEDDLVFYTKNEQNDLCELYKDGELIDSEVAGILCSDGDAIYYATDVDKKNGLCTLNVWDGDVKKIADDVHVAGLSTTAVLLGDGQVAFLADWDGSRRKGTLYVWDGGEPEKVDEDVVSLVFAIRRTEDSDNRRENSIGF